MTRSHRLPLALLLALVLVITGCSIGGAGKRGGGYYQDDGPDARPPSNLDQVPDAVPRIEPYASGASKPYVVFGKRYVPDTSGAPYRKQGIASWYGKKFHGNSTSIGEPYNMYAMTAAHTTLPLPSYARVTSLVNGKTIIVRVNDRGPFHDNRIMDLSYAAAYKLGIIGPGSGPVIVESITQNDIRRMAASNDATGSQPVAEPIKPAPVALTPQPLSPAASTSTSTLSESSPGATVYLQAGAFSQASNAQALVQRINSQLSGNASPPASVIQTGSLYRVKIGPYADRQQAATMKQLVFEKLGIDATFSQL